MDDLFGSRDDDASGQDHEALLLMPSETERLAGKQVPDGSLEMSAAGVEVSPEVLDQAHTPRVMDRRCRQAGCASIRLRYDKTGNVLIRYPPVTLMWRLTLGRL